MINYRGISRITDDEREYCTTHIHERNCKEKIFESYVPYVLKVSSIISKKNPNIDIEDIINEGMIGLWKAILHYNPDKSNNIFALIKICVRNSILEYVRKLHKHDNVSSLDIPTIDGDETTKLYEIIEDDRFDLDREIYSNEIINTFDKVLSERDKNIMEDFFIKQIKQKDIVKKYGLSGQGHVALIVRRAKKKIRESFQ